MEIAVPARHFQPGGGQRLHIGRMPMTFKTTAAH